MAQLYDRIGVGYRALRVPDPRIAAAITAALGDAASVANVGAGAGSYEPRDRRVIAIEPAGTMIRQRAHDAAPAVRGSGDAIPLRDACVDAALAVLTIHHWPDRARGLAELKRIARLRVVLLTHLMTQPFWLLEYFPGVLEIDRGIMPSLDELERALGPLQVTPVPIPHDCSDGFLGAHWRRPAAYLRDDVRAAISSLARLAPGALHDGVARLRADLDSGAWQERHGELLGRDALDLGYRIVVAQL
ncbi:MAG TPA: methyltransferase domain-containing protein [Myxococcota bacterium]|nr:methyltransferase domain-containing protein [Myxococcota bacterium]